MRIRLITPAPPQSRAGNRTTAMRWAAIMRSLGHRVEVSVDYAGEPAHLMVALHAWRSAAAIARFAAERPGSPLVVALTGTDAYRFLASDAEVTLGSLALADRLVGLHAAIADAVPPPYRDKVRVIYQSARLLAQRQPVRRSFRVLVVGHLREEKDPLRPALAARALPASSRLRIEHFGKAHDPTWADAARAEMALNPRYRWHGEVTHARIRRAYASAHLLVLPSRMEGGANVVSEAVAAGLPVLASRIPGSLGLLGEDYPGYFPVANAGALAALMWRAESDPSFYQTLEMACDARRSLFTPEREREGWVQLLGELSDNR
jgi:putative glycosyltransferase (TIGR04348 family)